MKYQGQTVEEAIRIEAYLLSEKAGHPAGMERMFWKQAEALLNERAAALVKATVAKPTKRAAGAKAPAPAAMEPKPVAAKKSSAVKPAKKSPPADKAAPTAASGKPKPTKAAPTAANAEISAPKAEAKKPRRRKK